MTGRTLLLLVPAAVVVFVGSLVEPSTVDLRFAQRSPGAWPSDLVLVEIDERAQNEYGTWRWPRARTAELIERIQALEPKTIAPLFYVARPEPLDPTGDRALTRALLGTVPASATSTQLWADRDHVVRRYAPVRGGIPSVAMAALLQHRERDVAAVPLHRGSFLLDFDGTESTPTVISAADIMSGRQDRALRAQLEGKLVLVSIVHQTMIKTPVGPMSEGLVQAHAIRSMDSGRVPRLVPMPRIWQAALVLFLALVFTIVQRLRPRSLVLMLGVAGLLFAYVTAAFALVMAADTFIPMATPVLVTLYAAGAFLVLPRIRDLEHRDRLAPDAADAAQAPIGRVTIVFTDIEDSTTLWEDHQDAMAQALALHNQTMRRWIRRVGAYEVKTEGDAFMIAAPTVEAALQLCLGAQNELMTLDWPDPIEEYAAEPGFRGLRVRMGVHVGTPDPQPTRTGRMDYFGPEVNRAARIAAMAYGGQIILSGTAWREAEEHLATLGSPKSTNLGQYKLKGLRTLEQLVSLVPKELEHRTFDAHEGSTLAPARRVRSGPARVGSRLADRYQLIEILGEGGMATVYRAMDLELNEDVAIKVLHRSLRAGGENLTQIKNELKTARRVSDAGVVRLHDFGVDAGDVFITMELAEGGSLADRLELERPTGTEATRIAGELAKGLAAVHREGVVHCDIKPQNVLFDAIGRARLADFGISQFETENSDPEEIFGTPQYMSPEQLRGQAATPASDVYSLGILLYELFAGRLPFQGSLSNQISQRLYSEAPPLDDVEPEIAAVIQKALSRDASERFQNGQEVVAALADA